MSEKPDFAAEWRRTYPGVVHLSDKDIELLDRMFDLGAASRDGEVRDAQTEWYEKGRQNGLQLHICGGGAKCSICEPSLAAARAEGAEAKRKEVERRLAPVVEAMRKQAWASDASSQKLLNEWSHAIREATLPPSPEPSELAVKLAGLSLDYPFDVDNAHIGALTTKIDALLREKGVMK